MSYRRLDQTGVFDQPLVADSPRIGVRFMRRAVETDHGKADVSSANLA
ncbi:hypothetical protein [Reyranella sp.]|nr:hypothetical protein [Reyranella sp.]